MITHEEIRNIAKDNLHFSVRKPVLDYVSQQEKKDELLGLYQLIWKTQNQDELTISAYTYEDLIELISKKEKLEKELGEMK